MDLIAVLTCPRGKSYLPDTLASLDRAGADSVSEKHVVADGVMDSDIICSRGNFRPWGVRQLGSGPSGNLNAVLETFKFALRSGADRLLYFEDDIVACTNAIPRMLEVDVPDDCAWTSFFDMKEIPYGMPPGIYAVSTMGKDGRGFWGAQAMMIPARTMRFAVENQSALRAYGNKHCGDCLLGYELLRQQKSSYAVHVPNLVEHVGAVSAIWSWTPKINRRSTSFPGEAFDAYTLAPVR